MLNTGYPPGALDMTNGPSQFRKSHTRTPPEGLDTRQAPLPSGVWNLSIDADPCSALPCLTYIVPYSRRTPELGSQGPPCEASKVQARPTLSEQILLVISILLYGEQVCTIYQPFGCQQSVLFCVGLPMSTAKPARDSSARKLRFGTQYRN